MSKYLDPDQDTWYVRLDDNKNYSLSTHKETAKLLMILFKLKIVDKSRFIL